MNALLLITLLSFTSPAEAALRIDVDGMSCGQGCPPRAEKALLSVDGVDRVRVDFESESACLETSKDVSPEQLSAALSTENYTLGEVAEVAECAVAPVVHPRDPWAKTDGVDAKIISDGFEFELDAHRVPDKFTIFDFGASWCGPCHVAANQLREILAQTPDLAVRAISLGHDPKASFDYPVVKQHMAFASGLPWFIVVSPSGKKIYEGAKLDDALKAIKKKRK
jgi:thiol-disulfide isomerase/thioredoxin